MITTKKFNWVNAMIGYAILLVMLIHSSQAFKVSDFTIKLCNLGDLGVQLFFILSSFTLFNSYSNRITEENESVKVNFFIRRFFRIAPYYYTTVVIYVFYRIIIKNQPINFKNLIANFTFTNGIYLPGINDIPPGGWSIGVEMLFYLLIPFLFKSISSLKRAVLVFVLAFLFSIMVNHYFLNQTSSFLHFLWQDYNKWALYFWLPNQLPVFILGIILYHINKNFEFSVSLGQLLLLVSIIFFLGLSFVKFNLEYPFYFIKREYIYSVIFLLISIGVYTTQNKLVINDFIQKIGIVSFSMYLNHFLIISFLGYLFNGFRKVWIDFLKMPLIIIQNDFVFIFFYFSIVILTFYFSKLTYKYIEIKGIKMGNKMINKLSANKIGFNQ